ncbi:hypothetical protein MES5069_30148 [Mesorhizobium escarrei]|uniref:Uncharacterized protein n=1 Tax=Mesorhizobium escarrei TaxID=666018 RepID=A0ABM9DY86_9HYPH|nr:hypothetical protein MES5069_30148 [Mesorhizobium escarrei]
MSGWISRGVCEDELRFLPRGQSIVLATQLPAGRAFIFTWWLRTNAKLRTVQEIGSTIRSRTFGTRSLS